jgi:hypothetical protein
MSDPIRDNQRELEQETDATVDTTVKQLDNAQLQINDAGAPVVRKSKTQGQIIWEQFKRHKSALVGGWILVFMYLTAIFAGFLAPYGLNEYRRSPTAAFRPPTQVHWVDPDTGRLTRPFV